MRRKKSEHFHSNTPFPNLTSGVVGKDLRIESYPLTPNHKTIIQYLKTGASLLLDMKEKKVVLYEAGIQLFKTLSIRTLSFLVKKGLVKVENREGARVHYTLMAN